MAKVEKTHEDAVATLEAAKENLKAARTALREFKVENEIKKDTVPEDAKIKTKLEKLVAAAEKAAEALEVAKTAEKELRPQKERVVIYDYPEGMSDKDKKKFRAKARRDKKAGEKAADAPDVETKKEKKAKKEDKKEEAPAAGASEEKKKVVKKPIKKEED